MSKMKFCGYDFIIGKNKFPTLLIKMKIKPHRIGEIIKFRLP